MLRSPVEPTIATVDVDPKFPQAIGIASILKNTAMFGNFRWEVLHNSIDDSPYFTSDHPVAIEMTAPRSARNKIVPLSPNLAIRIRPNHAINSEQADFTFSNFDYQSKELRLREIEQINRLIVRCAEELVFFRDNHPWVPGFVRKHRHFRIEYHERGQHIVETLSSTYTP